jgi:hypothetical protein
MKCSEVRSWFHRKIDDELQDFENRELDAHMKQCASCKEEYRLLSFPRRIARAISPPSISPYFYQKLWMRIEGETQMLAGWQAVRGLARQMIPALAGITLALLSVLVYLQLRIPDTDLYRAYGRAIMSDDASHRMIIAQQGEITNESVLSAIAERDLNRRRNPDLE